MRWITLLPLYLVVTLSYAADGLLSQVSEHSVADTADRLEKIVSERGFTVFARVDHAQGAERVGLALRPTQLLIFGNPKGGTLLMQQAQTAGIDLPLKYLVWQDDEGQVHIGWNAPAYIAERHGVPDDLPVLEKMTKGLASMAQAAATP